MMSQQLLTSPKVGMNPMSKELQDKLNAVALILEPILWDLLDEIEWSSASDK